MEFARMILKISATSSLSGAKFDKIRYMKGIYKDCI